MGGKLNLVIGLSAIIVILNFLGVEQFSDIFSEDNDNTQIITLTPKEPKIREIKIEDIKSSQEIYEPGEKAYIEFVVKNTLGVPYNITVDWIHNDTRYEGWFNVSTDYYDVTNEYNGWESWSPRYKKGEWKAHVVIKYEIENKPKTLDKTFDFQVI